MPIHIQTTPKAPELDSQIEEKAYFLRSSEARALAELTHGREMLDIDFISCEVRKTSGNYDLDSRRSDDEISVMQVMQFAHYLQYEAPRFMDAWLRLAKKAKEGELLKAQQAKRNGEVLALALDKIKENEPDSPAFNMAATFVMEQGNETGEAAKTIFMDARNGEEFKAGLIEMMETHEEPRS